MNKPEHWYLIAYDIRDKKRLQRLYKFLQRHCLALQESVLMFHGKKDQWQQLRQDIRKRIKISEDDVRVYRLPPGVGIEFTGQLPWADDVFFGGYPPFTHKTLPGS
ncbi:CRISPR-associated endonuclease Cas2 [Alkalimonas sp. MEB108]|uniref:CRISPR-associated endoribonuclease Cas2 n=1 Tax=Alkalimonas cellulosilytica TaxID=3058395 RepID=A0ABU7J904_9GAMM|nr:CRISPR-associated endonuclease Cas2 [Alkalimonas sp. MEB108]MEE2003031.1 CRISPR-associated endonuclease Cas2 [Alkalimonas sp. MEB108]